jgi:hypothetical protein
MKRLAAITKRQKSKGKNQKELRHRQIGKHQERKTPLPLLNASCDCSIGEEQWEDLEKIPHDVLTGTGPFAA